MQDGTYNSYPELAQNARILVNIATYNEKDNIGKLIEEIHRYVHAAHVLVVDDNSPDGTGLLVDQLSSVDNRISVIHRPGKLGLGTAIIEAMNYAIQKDYDFMVNLDADFSHPPSALPALLAGMIKNDVMIGSRYMAGGGTANWALSRRFMSKAINMLVRMMFRMRVNDTSGGFRCYRVEQLRATKIDAMISRGYSFQQEMLFRCYLAGSLLGETPILFENRKYGKSKVSWHESVRSLSTIIYLGFRSLLGIEKPAARQKSNGIRLHTSNFVIQSRQLRGAS